MLPNFTEIVKEILLQNQPFAWFTNF